MPHTESRIRGGVGYALGVACVLASAASRAPAQTAAQPAQPNVTHANWELAERFSSAALKPVTYSDGVDPHWLGTSDSLWYNWKDHTGSHFYLVVPATRVKRPLFDQAKLAAALSELSHRAHVASDLPFTSVAFTRDHKAFHFTVDSVRYSWNLSSESLTSIGHMDPDSVLPDEEREA
ncbi:MAG TPA: hypothetical protein VFJ96_03120, partial [Gemmatimonadaceae bacterium]|nr:hypothetical protein [Gemmatimonadaceae bacterium]